MGENLQQNNYQAFGFIVFALKSNQPTIKLDENNTKCIFMEYDQNSKTYILINKEILKLIVSCDVTFNGVISHGEKKCLKTNNSQWRIWVWLWSRWCF